MALTVDTAWRVLTALDTDCAWRLQPALAVESAWRVLTQLEAESAWRLQPALAVESAWRVLTRTSRSAAWRVLTELEAESAWRMKDGLSRDTAWRVQPAGGWATGWQMTAALTKATAWKVLNSPAVKTAWKISTTAGLLPGLNTHALTVTADGVAIDANAVTLSAEEGGLGWAGRLELANEAAYNACTAGAEIIVDLDGRRFVLAVAETGRQRDYAAGSWSVTLTGPLAAVAEETVSLTLENRLLASEAAALLLTGTSLDLSWETVNWELPEGLEIARNLTRRAALAKLCEACGAQVVATSEGALKVRPGWPLEERAAAEWEESRVLVLASRRTTRETYDRVLAGSSGRYRPRTVSLEIAERDDLDRSLRIKAVVEPEPVQPTITHCGPDTVFSLRYAGKKSESRTATVAFQQGVGSLSGVESLATVDWGDHDDLGAVSAAGPGRLVSATLGSSLAEITYTASWYEYILDADGSAAATTQLCASAEPVSADILVDCQTGAAASLAPEVLLAPACTAAKAAAERGRVWFKRSSGAYDTVDLSLVWDGGETPEIGELVKWDGRLGRLTRLEIEARPPAVSCRASLEVPA